MPAASAANSSGPEIRVSRPTRNRPPGRTRAAARPRASTNSGVRSRLATPRTPSVPKERLTEMRAVRAGRAPALPLGVLRSLAGLLQAVLLALLGARVAGEKAGPLERYALLGIELGQGAGDAEPQRTGLTRYPAAG